MFYIVTVVKQCLIRPVKRSVSVKRKVPYVFLQKHRIFFLLLICLRMDNRRRLWTLLSPECFVGLVAERVLFCERRRLRLCLRWDRLMDPPWGGPRYKEKKYIRLQLSNTPIEDVVFKLLRLRVSLIVLKVPTNFNVPHFVYHMNKKKENRIRSFHSYHLNKMNIIVIATKYSPTFTRKQLQTYCLLTLIRIYILSLSEYS